MSSDTDKQRDSSTRAEESKSLATEGNEVTESPQLYESPLSGESGSSKQELAENASQVDTHKSGALDVAELHFVSKGNEKSADSDVGHDSVHSTGIREGSSFIEVGGKPDLSLAPVIETPEAAAEVAGALLVDGGDQFPSTHSSSHVPSQTTEVSHNSTDEQSTSVNEMGIGGGGLAVDTAGVSEATFDQGASEGQTTHVVQSFDGNVSSSDSGQTIGNSTVTSQILSQGDLSISVTPTGHVFHSDSSQPQEGIQTADGTVDLQAATLAGQGFQQHPTYVLLQAPGDQDSGGQPQVFLAMQTAGITGQDPQQAYITLHPVSVEGQEISGTFTDGINLQQAIIGQVGVTGDVATMELGQQIAIGDLKGLQASQGAETDGSQLLMSSGGQVMATASVTDGSQQSVITYLPSLATVSGTTGQIVIAAADGSVDVNQAGILATSQAQSVLTTVASNAGSTASVTSKSVSSSQPRRRLSNDPRTCDQCGRSFKYPSDLKKHLQIHTDIKKFHCEECNRSFRRLHQLNVHKRIHSGDKPYVCNRCGSKFRHDSTLTMHIRTRHDHLKPFACDGCGKKFGRMSHLRKHQRNVCGKGGQRGAIVACKYCEESFVKKMDLKTHIMVCEKRPEKPEKEATVPASFVCEHCGKEFARHYDFKRHGLCHTDEKPFQCEGCSKTFKERSSLNKHIKRMHVEAHDGIHSGDNSQDDVMESEVASNEISAMEDHDGSTITSDQAVSAADIIVSLAANMVATSESDGTSTAQALAQAGVIQGPDGQIIQGPEGQIIQAGHTISAADILNFPEVAAALGFTTTPQDGTTQPTVITVSETVETDGVSAAMMEGVTQQIESAEVSIEGAEMETDQTISSVNVIVTKQVNGEGSYFNDHGQFEDNGQLIIDEESGITAHVSTARFPTANLTDSRPVHGENEDLEPSSQGQSQDLISSEPSEKQVTLTPGGNVDVEMNSDAHVKNRETREGIDGNELDTADTQYEVSRMKSHTELGTNIAIDSEMDHAIETS